MRICWSLLFPLLLAAPCCLAQPGTSYTEDFRSTFPGGGEVVFRIAPDNRGTSDGWTFWHRSKADQPWHAVVPTAEAPWRGDIGPHVPREILAISFLTPARGWLWGVESGHVYATPDSGRTWSLLAGLERAGVDAQVNRLAFCSAEEGAAIVYEAPPLTATPAERAQWGLRWTVYYTRDGGQSWERATLPPRFSGRTYSLRRRDTATLEMVDPKGQVVFVSSTGGSLWEPPE